MEDNKVQYMLKFCPVTACNNQHLYLVRVEKYIFEIQMSYSIS